MYLLLLLLALIVGIPSTSAADVQVEGREDLSHCRIYAWDPGEKVPIFHPLLSPTEPAEKAALEQGDREIRERIDTILGKRGWRKQQQNVGCLLSYSLIQELDLDIARMDEGGMAPRRNDGYGGGMAGGANTSLLLRGTFTLDVRTAGDDERIWRATLTEPMGDSQEWVEKARDFAEEVARVIPKLR